MSRVHSEVKKTKTRFYYGAADQQFADLYLPEQNDKVDELRPIVIVIHGGYWKDNHSLDSYATSQLIPELISFGLAVWNIEYRRMEANGQNTAAPWPTVFADVALAVDFINHIAVDRCIDLNQVYIIGHSAGGCLALWAASRKQIPHTSPLYQSEPLKISRAMAIGGVLNLSFANDLSQPEQVLRLMGGSETECPERYQACNPATLRDESVFTIIIHGANDTEVNAHQALTYDITDARNIQLEIWPDADHFSMLPHDGAWSNEQWDRLKDRIKALVG